MSQQTLDDIDLAEPLLLGWLASVHLDAHYVRAAGNYLYRLDGQGNEVRVVDFAGGYGSLMLGHNHPEIVACAQEMLAGGVPVHAQFSRHPYARDLAAALNTILHRETGDSEPFPVIFANSGAEAIEAAVKHAELDRVMTLADLQQEIAANIETARAAGFDVTEIEESNAARATATPVLLALEGGFHGKLMGTVQLTHNTAYRDPFSALGLKTRFVATADLASLPKIFAEEQVSLLDPVLADGRMTVVSRPLPVFCAFVVEPIQGEGGINVLDERSAGLIQAACADVGCPILVDEVQTGMGRTGTFLASSAIGLRGDYYALAKSLGGGVAKAAVMMARESRYRGEFELVHSSTFAKDAFSTTIALKVLELLEAGDGAAYRQASERGSYIGEMLASIQLEFPDVVTGVRGQGLMLGMEFRDQSGSSDSAIQEHAQGGTLGYAIAGMLLREHRVRTFPTASSPNTLRFEPSISISDADVAQLAEGLRAVCAVLRGQDGAALLGR
jgi:acetylornithine/succinyldiaminopimelate/putrescine aminotransferase